MRALRHTHMGILVGDAPGQLLRCRKLLRALYYGKVCAQYSRLSYSFQSSTTYLHMGSVLIVLGFQAVGALLPWHVCALELPLDSFPLAHTVVATGPTVGCC